MSDSHVSPAGDEPELLRDQFRQLLRYRWLIGGGIGIGLIGGAYLGITSADSYAANSDIVVRTPTTNPFDSSTAPDKSVNMNTERQTALSSNVAQIAAKKLKDGTSARTLKKGLQVTTPPQSLTLRFTYTADSPEAAARGANALADAYLTASEKKWSDLRDSMVARLKKQIDPLGKQQNELAQQLDAMTKGTSAYDAQQTANVNLKSRISTLQNQRDTLMGLDMAAGSVTQEATPPTGSDGLGLVISLALGGAFGIAFGLLAAWVRLVFDPSPRSTGDVARAVHAPVLGSLPRGAAKSLLAVDQTGSRTAEEYRSIAFRLAYDARFADRRRLLVVAARDASAQAATSVATNLAASFAETGKDVLLVEADLRAPGLSARLHTSAGRPGWSLPPDSDDNGWPGTRPLTVDAGEAGSFDLVAGQRVRNVARALTSSRTTRLIEDADENGSTVVVLAPPVLSYADALALVDRVDGVVIVCDLRSVHRTELVRIRELILGAGGTVLGAVTHDEGGHPARDKGAAKGTGHRAAGSELPPPAPRPAPPAEQRLGDGTETVTLRQLRPEDLRTGDKR
ncbi:lipopolysaccharide biosynthesis protein [Streptomyces sp. NPDC047046]|uniref:polysaccharide biosynthesis tyrosine autokinase n=1 Tax=Streptomyces sp. NPDC047046 TaxID=3155378 RepID=UPI0033DCD001